MESEVRAMTADYGYELVTITYGGPKRNPTLTIMIDKPGGVTADDCAEMSRRLGLLLDVLDPIPTSYQLAVSSPGIERPLVRMEDFERFAGRQASVRYYDESEKARTVVGELVGVRDGRVAVLVEGAEVSIGEDRIDAAHLTFDWDQLDVEDHSGES
ncbi:MAG: ribosome maturation factor RimP [Armatimonadetes bacterium]|nr:ribosome maturation factor RimP [Armatimonadota bacterium]